jgi:SAM-dependent methyltransferase
VIQPTLSAFKYFLDRDSYLAWLSDGEVQLPRRTAEDVVANAIQSGKRENFYCYAHRGIASLKHADAARSADGHYNWREFGSCEKCESITRIRLVAECLDRTKNNYVSPRIYLTEQLTSLYKLMRSQYVSLIGSEFVPNADERAAASARLRSFLGDHSASIRHEDCCALTIEDESLHIIGSFDVLEHIPDYRAAITEFFRVLKSGGQLFLSAPFLPASHETLVRARLTGDTSQPIEHLLPPEMHGNPTDPSGGALCFYHFGWDLLDEMRRAGFRSVALMEAWSAETATFGNQSIIVATK